MSAIVDAFLAELDDEALATLAQRLRPLLTTEAPASIGWLDVDGAAEHLACPKSRIYALSSAGRIPCHRDGSRVLFRREELDEWVRSGGGRRP